MVVVVIAQWWWWFPFQCDDGCSCSFGGGCSCPLRWWWLPLLLGGGGCLFSLVVGGFSFVVVVALGLVAVVTLSSLVVVGLALLAGVDRVPLGGGCTCILTLRLLPLILRGGGRPFTFRGWTEGGEEGEGWRGCIRCKRALNCLQQSFFVWKRGSKAIGL